MIVLRPCIICGCTELDACVLDGARPCSWISMDLPLCSNPECVSSCIDRLEQLAKATAVAAAREGTS